MLPGCTIFPLIKQVCSIVYRVPTLPGKPGILSFTFPDLENAWNLLKKWWKPGILTQNLKKNLCFANSVFQDSLFKMWFTKQIWFISLSYLHYQHKHWDSKPKWPWISLLLPGSNLENTWNFVSQRSGKPVCTILLLIDELCSLDVRTILIHYNEVYSLLPVTTIFFFRKWSNKRNIEYHELLKAKIEW